MMASPWMKLGVLLGLLVLVGCGQEPVSKVAKKGSKAVPASPAKAEANKSDGEPAGEEGHNGWWCAEHGVKEDECSMCQRDVFKKLKPDEICAKHPDRAKAQCFICNPELWEKNKAVYVAKYGKEPPLPVENKPAGK